MGLIDRLLRPVRRAVSVVAQALGLAPPPEPEPPAPRPAAPALAPPLPEADWTPPPIPLPSPRPPTPDELERWRWDRAAEAAEVWAQTRGAVAPVLAQAEALQAAPALSSEQLQALATGHPELLPPLEYLQRWEGLSEEEALARLEELEEEGEDLALPDRGDAVRAWERMAAAQTPASGQAADQAPPAQGRLQGGPLGAGGGTLAEAVRETWEKWARSTLARGGAPLTVELTVAGEDTFRPPWEVWLQGPEVVLDWLQQALGSDPRELRGGGARVEGFQKPESPRKRRAS